MATGIGPQIFSDLRATLSDELVSIIAKDGVLAKVLADLKSICGVTVLTSGDEDDNSSITLTGTAEEIKSAENYLRNTLVSQEGVDLRNDFAELSLKSLSMPDLASSELPVRDVPMRKGSSHKGLLEDMPSRLTLHEDSGSGHSEDSNDELSPEASDCQPFVGSDFPKEDAFYMKQTNMPRYIWSFMKQKCWIHIQSILDDHEAILTFTETKGDQIQVILKCYQKEKLDSAVDKVYAVFSSQPIGKTTFTLDPRTKPSDSDVKDIVMAVSQQAHQVVVIFENGAIDVIGTRGKVQEAMDNLIKLLKNGNKKISTKWLYKPPVSLGTFSPETGPVVHVHNADICTLPVEVAVCPTNGSLATSQGVAGAMHRGGGKEFPTFVADFLKKHGRLEMAHVGVTPAGDLKCRQVYHVYGPKAGEGGVTAATTRGLHEAFHNCLVTAHKNKVASIAIPAISCGNNGLPVDVVATAMVQEVLDFISKQGTDTTLKEIHLVDINQTILDSIASKLTSGAGHLPADVKPRDTATSAGGDRHHLREEGYKGRSSLSTFLRGGRRSTAEELPHASPMHTMAAPPRSSPAGPMHTMAAPPRSSPAGPMHTMAAPPRFNLAAGDNEPPMPMPAFNGFLGRHGDELRPRGLGTLPASLMTEGHAPRSGHRPDLLFSNPPLTKPLESPDTKSTDTRKVIAPRRKSKKSSTKAKAHKTPSPEPEETCCICLSEPTNPKTLKKCKHKFCTACIDQYFKMCNPKCPVCGTIYGVLEGNQPTDGTMTHSVDNDTHLPGYEKYGTIVIHYKFPAGTQTPVHPNPGTPYGTTYRRAYLPDNTQGRKLVQLLKNAFDARLMFTIGRSVTTGSEGVITWNDIHHKTNIQGGPTRYGYPDPTYLARLEDELKTRGIQ